MEKNEYTSNYYSPYGYDQNVENPMGDFNPMVQYEQAYMYYKYMSMQMDYKIKCKEYEKMCGRDHSRTERNN